MSANIAKNRNGGYSFAAREGVAVWWSNGDHHIMNADSSRDEWLAKAGLDWSVKTAPAFMMTDDGQYIPVPDRRVIYRADTNVTFDVASDHYRPHQNGDLFDTATEIADSLNLVSSSDVEGAESLFDTVPQFEIGVAGALGAGERIWVGLRTKANVKIAGDDHGINLNLLTGHNGMMSSKVLLSSTRIVCSNTMAMALASNFGVFSMRHNRQYNKADMIAGFAAIIKGVEQYKSIGDALVQVRMSQTDIVRYFKTVLGIDLGATKDDIGTDKLSTRKWNQYESLFQSYLTTAKETEANSAWAALNAVTRYVDHERISDDARRFDSANFGSGATMKIDALATLREMVAA